MLLDKQMYIEKYKIYSHKSHIEDILQLPYFTQQCILKVFSCQLKKSLYFSCIVFQHGGHLFVCFVLFLASTLIFPWETTSYTICSEHLSLQEQEEYNPYWAS